MLELNKNVCRYQFKGKTKLITNELPLFYCSSAQIQSERHVMKFHPPSTLNISNVKIMNSIILSYLYIKFNILYSVFPKYTKNVQPVKVRRKGLR